MEFKLNTIHSETYLENIEKQKQNFSNIIAIWNQDYINEAEFKKENNEREDSYTYEGFS
ncbi:site-specific integrase, partial [Bacillus proteolyticus]